MNPKQKSGRCGLTLIVASLAGAFSCLLSSARAETLPGGVSDIIRDLGEMRDVSWGLLESARKAYPTNESALADLNVRYIEASAVANSLIEQFQLETAAHTTLQVKRYEKTVARTKDKCQAFTNAWHKLMSPAIRTRGAVTNSSGSGSSSSGTGAGLPQSVDQSFTYAAKAVTIVDGMLGVLSKNKKTFRDLDEQQRVEVRKLLEERRWKSLDWSARDNQAVIKESGAPAGKPAGSKSGATNSPTL